MVFGKEPAFVLVALGYLMVCGVSPAQLEVSAAASPQVVFAGKPQEVPVVLKNKTSEDRAWNLSFRVYQASSATLMPIAEARPWKQIQILPEQTVLEIASITLPAVKATTYFQIHWQDDEGTVFGKTLLVAVPINIAKAISVLTADSGIGIWDPQERIKPLFKAQGVEFSDLSSSEDLANFKGRLVLVWLYPEATQVKEFAERVVKKASSGTAVIAAGLEDGGWKECAPVQLIRSQAGNLVLTDSRLLEELSTSAKSQLHLFRLASVLLTPKPSPLISLLP